MKTGGSSYCSNKKAKKGTLVSFEQRKSALVLFGLNVVVAGISTVFTLTHTPTNTRTLAWSRI